MLAQEPLGDPTGDIVGLRLSIPQGHILSSICEVGPEPLQTRARKSSCVLEMVEENFVVDCIKCSCGSRILRSDGKDSSHQGVIGDPDQDSICAVGGLETGLRFVRLYF